MLKVYLVQMESRPLDKFFNMEKARKLIENAHTEAGGLILLPEMFATGFIPERSLDTAEYFEQDKAGATSGFLSDMAKKTGCTILGGGVCRKNQSVTNHIGFFDHNSHSEICGYDKIHLFFSERKNLVAGDNVVTHKLNNFNIAPSICFDLRFPEFFQTARRNGANLFAIEAAWPDSRIAHWDALLKARAIENQAFVAAVNCVSEDRTYSGNSQVISPTGEILAKAERFKEMVISATIDIDAVSKCRSEFPLF